MNPPEIELFVWVAVGLIAVALYRFVLWIRTAPVKPDPWEELIGRETAGDASQSICWRCLEPVDEGRDFCEHCGLSVGPCTNLSPYLYLFALGDGLRTGTTGRFAVTPLTVAGFLILSTCEYLVFAPIYWFFLIRNIRRLEEETLPTLPPVHE